MTRKPTRAEKAVVQLESFAPAELEKAIEGLRCGFPWDDSDEGFDYWDGVVEKLIKYRTALAAAARNLPKGKK